MKAEWGWIVATALLWGAYPLVSRTANYEGPRAALILMIAGFIPVTLMAALSANAGWPTSAGLLKLIISGLMMGGGLVAFIMLANGRMDLSIAIPVVDVAMLLVSAVGAILFFAEPVTLQKVLGITLLLVGIGLLRPT